METPEVVRQLIEPGDYFVSLDLKNGYFHVGISQSDQPYLCFSVDHKFYMFTSLPFGASSAPRIFTKLLKPVVTLLRAKGIRCTIYIDDLLLVAHSRMKCLYALRMTLRFLVYLGFVVNLGKSTLEPSQSIEYLGFEWCSASLSVRLTEKRRQKCVEHLQSALSNDEQSLRSVAAILGSCTSMLMCFPNVPLYYRSLQLLYITQLEISGNDFSTKIHLTSDAKQDIQSLVGILKVSPITALRPPQPTMTICTDASTEGWGATCGLHSFRGKWSRKEHAHHINFLELLTVLKSLRHWKKLVRGKCILIRCDNTTALSYLRHRGGTHSPQLCELALLIWSYFIKYRVSPIFEYIASVDNFEADSLSRGSTSSLDWVLSPMAFSAMSRLWGQPEVDLFASEDAAQVAMYLSPCADSGALSRDALAYKWNKHRLVYMFPPAP